MDANTYNPCLRCRNHKLTNCNAQDLPIPERCDNCNSIAIDKPQIECTRIGKPIAQQHQENPVAQPTSEQDSQADISAHPQHDTSTAVVLTAAGENEIILQLRQQVADHVFAVQKASLLEHVKFHEMEAETYGYQEEIRCLEQTTEDQCGEIKWLRETVAGKDEELEWLQSEVAWLQGKAAGQDKEIEWLRGVVAGSRGQSASLVQLVETLPRMLQDANGANGAYRDVEGDDGQ